MLTKNEIKLKLLSSNLVVDNEYLDKYAMLIENNLTTKRKKFVTQRHHIIPRYYYKLNNLLLDNSKDNIVNLPYKYHFLAHLYLSKCSINEEFAYNNTIALYYMTNKVDFNSDWDKVDLELLQEEYEKAREYLSKHNPMYDEKIREKHLRAIGGKPKTPSPRKGVDMELSFKEKVSKTLKEKYLRGELFSKEHREKISNAQKDMSWVNKDGVYKRIHKKDFEKYLEDGWVRGGRPLSKEHQEAIRKSHVGKKYSDELRKKLSEAHKGQVPPNKGVPMSDEQKEKLHNYYVGTRWMNNGVIQKQVKPCDIDEYIANGFVFGRLYTKGR